MQQILNRNNCFQPNSSSFATRFLQQPQVGPEFARGTLIKRGNRINAKGSRASDTRRGRRREKGRKRERKEEKGEGRKERGGRRKGKGRKMNRGREGK